ncbi:reverse transcriptase, partial [Oesophagostomum dentatum]
LLATGAIQRVNHTLHDSIHVHPLSVAIGKKLRLVLDLSHLNSFVRVPRFKFEDVSKLIHVLPRGGYMSTFDFKSGYHHLKINPDHTKFLGFKWQGNLYQFLCLPFGLSSAPHIFTKILRPFIKKWRSAGLGIALYLDDGIVFASSRADCSRTVAIVKDDLSKAGFQFAENKCKWDPAQITNWLGFQINLKDMFLRLSQDRLARAKDRLVKLLRSSKPSLHERLRWSGTTASMHLIMSSSDKRNTMAISREIAAAQTHEFPLFHRWQKSREES